MAPWHAWQERVTEADHGRRSPFGLGKHKDRGGQCSVHLRSSLGLPGAGTAAHHHPASDEHRGSARMEQNARGYVICHSHEGSH
jgi:hypothetical protein